MGYVITMSGEYGAGTRLIGEQLANNLGVKFYDRALLNLTAEKCGYTVDYVREATEHKPSSIMYSLFTTALPADSVFNAMSQVITDIAARENAVIAGACADYILRDKRDCMRVFVVAPVQQRIARARDVYGVIEPDRDPQAQLNKLSRGRVAYHDYFTQNKWGLAENYDICVNSALGIEKTAEIITLAARASVVEIAGADVAGQ